MHRGHDLSIVLSIVLTRPGPSPYQTWALSIVLTRPGPSPYQTWALSIVLTRPGPSPYQTWALSIFLAPPSLRIAAPHPGHQPRRHAGAVGLQRRVAHGGIDSVSTHR